MSIYKVAQEINFSNEIGVKSKVGRMRDPEFSAYVSVLSQIHQDIKNNIDLEESVLANAGQSQSKAVLSLINDIGTDIFKTENFDNIIRNLETFRSKPETKKPETAPIDLNTIEAIDLFSMKSAERDKFLRSLDYPPELYDQVNQMLENIRMMDAIYSDSATPDFTKEIHKEEMLDAIQTLLEIARGEGEFEENFEPEESAESLFKKPALPPGITPEKGEEPVKKIKYVSNASTSSKLSRDDVFEKSDILKAPSFKEFLDRSNNPYIDFSVIPPIFNDDMSKAFGNFVQKIEEIGQQAAVGTTAALKEKLNDVIFSIKAADTLTFEALEAALKVVPDEYKKEYDNIQHQFLNECPSARIFTEGLSGSNKGFFSQLFMATIFLSSPKLGKMIMNEDNQVLKQQQKKYVLINDDNMEDIKNEILDFAYNQFQRKAERFFQLSNRYREKNFISQVGLSFDKVLKRGLEKILPSGPSYELRPCPTCYKWVPWSYSTEAKKESPLFEGFKIRPMSLFTYNSEKPKITLKELNSQKWPAPSPALYSRERERELVLKYAKEGERSWSEIQALLNSNDRVKHEEGWHRRTGALQKAGAMPLTTSDIFIKMVQNECPVDPNQGGKSACGISFAPTKGTENLPASLILQPQWNGVKDSGDEKASAVSVLIEDLWEDKKMFQQARKQQSSGFKFSKINFACTCRIGEIDNLSSYKHSNVAVSKTGGPGSRGYVYPTKANGSPDIDLADGTMTYMVCGAPTSLSSFDRNPSSAGFILKYLQTLSQNDLKNYADCLNFLIRQGVDIQDVLELDASLEAYVAEGIEKQSLSIQERMKKIAKIILSDADRSLLGGLTLVCPFGHRFTIDHTLKFAEAHAGIFQKKNIATTYSDFITTQGEANIRALIQQQFLVRANFGEMSIFKNKLSYDEWVRVDPTERVVFPDFKHPEKALLKFSITNMEGEDVDYIFGVKKFGWKDTIWPADGSFTSYRYEPKSTKVTNLNQGVSGSESFGAEGEGPSVFDKMEAQNWEIDQNNPVTEYGYNRAPGSKIPGTLDLEDDTGISQVAFDQKIAAFSRTLKSALRVIITWTKGLISPTMMSALLTDYKIDVAPHADSILNVLMPHIDFESLIPEEPLTPEDLLTLKQDVKTFFIESINRKANKLYDWIRSNIHNLEEREDFDSQVAASIIQAAIQEFNSSNPDVGFDSEYGQAFFPPENLNGLAKTLAKKITDTNHILVSELLLRTKTYLEFETRRVQYTSRISLVSYAQYLAQTIVNIYKKYCKDPNSPLYVGYNIGIDLSSVDKILGYELNGEWKGGITEEGVQNITSSLEEAVEKSGQFKQVKNQALHYGYRIDRAWEELESYLNRAKKQTMSARAMELSKDYIVSRMSFISGNNIDEIRNRISNSLPQRSILFKGTTEEPETYDFLVSKRRLPFTSKSVPFTDIPGTKRVEEWIVRNKKTKTNVAFNSEEKARAYLNNYLSEHPEESQQTFAVDPDPYWINEENGYDGSRFQIGITCPKVITDFKWPPDPRTMEFVGINFPFAVPNIATDASMSKISPALFPDYRFVVDFDGAPLDISFLIRKGNSEKEFGAILKAENKIINLARESKQQIEIFPQKHSKEISEKPSLLADFTAQEEDRLSQEISIHLLEINNMNMALSTKSSYVDPDKSTSRKMSRAVLEDPIRAYKLIMNPQTRGVELTSEEQQNLLNFVIRVYNLELVAETARNIGGVFTDIRAIDLLEKTDSINFKSLGPKLKAPVGEKMGWVHSPGEYFNLIPGSSETDSGSYLQYTYNLSPNVVKGSSSPYHAQAQALINSSIAAKRSGLLTTENEGEEKGAMQILVNKIEKDMLDYISQRTSGSRKNDARDKRGRKKNKKASEEYSYKIGLRSLELERILLSMGLQGFDDVEIPNF